MKMKNVCTYCQHLIKDLVIICKECQNFILCVQCFRLGAEIGKHKYTHKFEYNVTNLPIFSVKNAWSALEEIKLLDAIEHYGLGNWEGISSVFNNKRTAEEISGHFEKYYIEGNIGKETLQITNNENFIKNVKVSPLDNLPKYSIYGNAIGYMPLRDDYEREYLNNAEIAIKDLHYEPTDDNLEIRCKYALYDNFCRVLKERQKRKNFAKDYAMIRYFFEGGKLTSSSSSCSEEMRKLREKVCHLARDPQFEIPIFNHVSTPTNATKLPTEPHYRTPTPTLLKTFRGSLFRLKARRRGRLGKAKNPGPKSMPSRLVKTRNNLRGKYRKIVETGPRLKRAYNMKSRGKASRSKLATCLPPPPDDNARDGLNAEENEMDNGDKARLKAEPDRLLDDWNGKKIGEGIGILDSNGLIDWDNPLCVTLKPFARFYRKPDFVKLCNNILEYQKVKTRMERLKECRKFGITKLTDADKFISEYLIPLEEEKSKRGKSSDSEACHDDVTIKKERLSFSSNSSLLSEESSSDLAEAHTEKNLSSEERKLATNMQLKPAIYNTYKNRLLQHDALAKTCASERSYRPIRLEKRKRDRLVTFLREKGFVHNLI